MTLQDYLRVIRLRWRTLAVVVVLGLAAAASLFFVRPADYTATTELFVSSQPGSDPGQAFQGAQLSQQRVQSYAALVTSDRTMRGTIEQLGLSDTPESLADDITVAATADTVIIQISATRTSPEAAAQLANTVSSVSVETINELERPAQPGIAPSVVVRTVQDAQLPDGPSSTGLPVTLLLGLIAGALIGVGLAVLRHTLDRSITSAARLVEVTGSPVLGVIPLDPRIKEHPLVVSDRAQDPAAEAFRGLRTNLRYTDIDKAHRVIVVTSAVAGEGKSTVVANLAIAMGASGMRVMVIDADLRRPTLASLFGMERSVGLTRVLAGSLRLHQAVQSYAGGQVEVLASGPVPPNPSELLASNQMRRLLDELRRDYDAVLIDSPPVLPVTDAVALAPATDGVVLVTRHGSTSAPQVESALAAVRAVSVEPLGFVLTASPNSPNAHGYGRYSSISDVVDGTARVPGRPDTASPTVRHAGQIAHGPRRSSPEPSWSPRSGSEDRRHGAE